jgi:hypothetical protein
MGESANQRQGSTADRQFVRDQIGALESESLPITKVLPQRRSCSETGTRFEIAPNLSDLLRLYRMNRLRSAFRARLST